MARVLFPRDGIQKDSLRLLSHFIIPLTIATHIPHFYHDSEAFWDPANDLTCCTLNQPVWDRIALPAREGLDVVDGPDDDGLASITYRQLIAR